MDASDTLISDADRLREEAFAALNKIRDVAEEVEDTVDDINQLSIRLTEGEGKISAVHFPCIQ